MSKLFGEQFRIQRKKQGLTVQMVAKICETSRSYITLIESGKRLPGRKILPKIAQALQVKTNVVLNWYLEELSERLESGQNLS